MKALEDKAVAEHIKNLGRGFAGGVVVRHKGVADEISTFIKEAQNSRLKQLAKLSANKSTLTLTLSTQP